MESDGAVEGFTSTLVSKFRVCDSEEGTTETFVVGAGVVVLRSSKPRFSRILVPKFRVFDGTGEGTTDTLVTVGLGAGVVLRFSKSTWLVGRGDDPCGKPPAQAQPASQESMIPEPVFIRT